jgi:hypothetical protein
VKNKTAAARNETMSLRRKLVAPGSKYDRAIRHINPRRNVSKTIGALERTTRLMILLLLIGLQTDWFRLRELRPQA